MPLSLKLKARFAPRSPRLSVTIDSSVLLPDERVAPIVIKNISPGGFMGETEAIAEPGSDVGVVIPGCGIVPARVQWSDDGVIGAQFRRPLDLARLEQSPQGETPGLFKARVVQGPL
jgi:hypothetical protein